MRYVCVRNDERAKLLLDALSTLGAETGFFEWGNSLENCIPVFAAEAKQGYPSAILRIADDSKQGDEGKTYDPFTKSGIHPPFWVKGSVRVAVSPNIASVNPENILEAARQLHMRTGWRAKPKASKTRSSGYHARRREFLSQSRDDRAGL